LTPEQKGELRYDDDYLDQYAQQFFAFYSRYVIGRCYNLKIDKKTFQDKKTNETKEFMQLDINNMTVCNEPLNVTDSKFFTM